MFDTQRVPSGSYENQDFPPNLAYKQQLVTIATQQTSPPPTDLHRQSFCLISYWGTEGLTPNLQVLQPLIFPSSKIFGQQQQVFKDTVKFNKDFQVRQVSQSHCQTKTTTLPSQLINLVPLHWQVTGLKSKEASDSSLFQLKWHTQWAVLIPISSRNSPCKQQSPTHSCTTFPLRSSNSYPR